MSKLSISLQGLCRPQIQHHLCVSSNNQCRTFFDLTSLTSSSGSGQRKLYREHRIVGYTKEQLFEIVYQTQHYERFLPGCHRSVVKSRSGDKALVELEVGFPPMLETYTSEVTFQRPHLVRARSRSGSLFSNLSSEWRFADVRDPDYFETKRSDAKLSPTNQFAHPNRKQQLCKIEFSVEFEFKNPFVSRMANLVFDQTAHQTMEAFLRRARQVYGDPDPVPHHHHDQQSKRRHR